MPPSELVKLRVKISFAISYLLCSQSIFGVFFNSLAISCIALAVFLSSIVIAVRFVFDFDLITLAFFCHTPSVLQFIFEFVIIGAVPKHTVPEKRSVRITPPMVQDFPYFLTFHFSFCHSCLIPFFMLSLYFVIKANSSLRFLCFCSSSMGLVMNFFSSLSRLSLCSGVSFFLYWS